MMQSPRPEFKGPGSVSRTQCVAQIAPILEHLAAEPGAVRGVFDRPSEFLELIADGV